MAKVLSKYILIHFQVIYFNIYVHNKIYNFGNLGIEWEGERGELKPWQDEWWHSIRLIHTRVFKENITLDKVGKF